MPRSHRAKHQRRPRLEALKDRILLSVSLLADVGTSPLSSNPNTFASANGLLFFRASDPFHGEET